MSVAPEAADRRYLAGVALFNAGDYFAAHEVWEDLWRDCRTADRRFYHSLIQAAVALYHATRGNRPGAARLLSAGREKMSGYPDRHLGLDTIAFWHEVCVVVEDLLAGRQPVRPVICLSSHPDRRPER